MAATAGCDAAASEPGEAPQGVELAKSSLARATTPSTTNAPALGTSNAEFAFDLYRGIAAKNPGANLVFSPYSISTALAMTYEGARGTTESEMKTTLHFDLDKPALHEAFNATDLALTSRGSGKSGADGTPFRLRVNNSIWAQRETPVVPAFLDVMAVNYGAGVFLADFAGDPEGSRKAINAWVANRTEQLIPQLLQPGVIDGTTRFVLTNTVYFNASWRMPFEKAHTADAPFTKLDGNTVSSKAMNAVLSIPYARGTNFRAVSLPYDDEALRFIAILPDQGALAALEASLRGTSLAALESQWTTTSVELRLPQLDYKQSTELNGQLIDLGMKSAFSDADFSGLTPRGVAITAVVHEATIKVLEEGTIAAAATAVVLGESADPRGEETMRFDRPFLYAIVDQPTGAVLFLGRVLDPTTK